MLVATHSIWSMSSEVMTLEIIVVFYIHCPSLTLIFVLFNPSPHFSISFEILNEAKLIHHYVNGNSYKINLALNVLLPELILVMMVYYFSISFVFLNVNLWNYGYCWLANQLNTKSSQLFPAFKLFSTIHFICHLFPNLKNNYGI